MAINYFGAGWSKSQGLIKSSDRRLQREMVFAVVAATGALQVTLVGLLWWQQWPVGSARFG